VEYDAAVLRAYGLEALKVVGARYDLDSGAVTLIA
jgi:hypothetical protein